MAESGIHEVIEAVFKNVQVQRTFGIVREYDIIFTDKGILFILVAGAWKVGVRDGLAAGVAGGLGGAVGSGISHAIWATLRNSLGQSKNKIREQYYRMDVKEMLSANEYNLYFPHSAITKVTVKKKLMGQGGMNIETVDSKVQTEFPKELLDSVRSTVSVRLSGQLF
jgi:hypothetical protein